MLRIKDVVTARETVVEGEYYIDLSIRWPTDHRGYAFTFLLEGDDGGYVEFMVDADNGSLRSVVVLILPPVDASLSEPPAPSREGHLVVHPGLAPYIRDTNMSFTTHLRWHDLGDRYLMQLFSEPVTHYVVSGDVRFGLTADDRLATLSAPKPDIEKGMG